jgi:hypothetical protein
MTLPLGSVVESVMFAGTVMTGGVESITVTVTLKDAGAEGLPRESLAEQVTGVTPELKRLPEAGEQLAGTDPSTRSFAVGAVQLTATGGESVDAGWSPGTPLRTGPVVSWTVTLNVPWVVRSASNVQVTRVVEIGNSVPGAEQVTPGSGVKDTTAPFGPVASAMMSAGTPSARADASGVPHSTSTAQTAIRPLTLIL